jgi:hypothetical protein
MPAPWAGIAAAMPRPRPLLPSAAPTLNPAAAFVRLRARILELPPVPDVLVIGADAPAKAKILREAFRLRQTGEFSRLSAGGKETGAILVRTALLRRIDADDLRRLIRQRIRRLMTSREVLALRIELETTLCG